MRLLERTRRAVAVAPRRCVADALGTVMEGFDVPGYRVKASCMPASEGLRDHATGRLCAASMLVLFNGNADIHAGDGLCVDTETPDWRAVKVTHWTAHTAVQAERVR